MCELLGICFNQPVTPSFSFRGFRKKGENNRNGWGLAYYPDECTNKSAQVFKEPIKATESQLAEFIRNYPKIKSKIIIAHVRLASQGDPIHKNTHPFSRELNGKEFVFAHNGTIKKFKKLELGRFKPIGETDSEHIFCHLLYLIEEKNINNWEKEDFEWLHENLKRINEYGTLNCLFSDGTHLFCYHDKSGYMGLCFVHRVAPFKRVRLLDEDFEINLAEEKEPSQKGFIIATNRLTDEKWENFLPGELIVFKDGEIIFSSTGRNSKQFSTPLSENELKILKLLRESPHRLSLRKIKENINISREELLPLIHSLLCKGYIRQDKRDKVEWNHNEATFYTEPSKRAEIDELIKKFK